MSCDVTELDETCKEYYRPRLRVLLEVLQTPEVRYWGKGAEDEGPGGRRQTQLHLLAVCVSRPFFDRMCSTFRSEVQLPVP